MPRVSFVRSFGRFGSSAEAGDIHFSRPQSIALDQERRRLIVSDACNHRVGVFTLEGELVRWFGSVQEAGDGPGQLKYPYGLALAGDGSALLAEFGNNRLQRIDLDSGACLGLFGVGGRGKGQLVTPWGVALIGDEAFVLDSGNNRVQVIDRPRGTRRWLARSSDNAGGAQ
jgi:DNA-binding beta-propeller fold protein YncE